MKNMKKNHEDLFPQWSALPHWLKSGTFHVLFNEYNHLEGNSIDFHDDGGETYSFLDPICAFRFKSPEFFWSSANLSPRKARRRRLTKHPFFCCFRILAIVWSCLVTSSSSTNMLFLPKIKESRQYEGVPICSDDEHWTQFCKFLDHLQKDSERANTTWALRWNCTLRWHRNRIGGCRYAVRNQPPESMPARQPGPGPLTTRMQNAFSEFSDSVEYKFGISRAECSSLSRQLQVVQLFGQVL